MKLLERIQLTQKIEEIDSACFDEPWSLSSFEWRLENPNTVFVVDDYGYALGVALSGEFELHRMAVLPEFRKQGKAYSLFRKFSEKCVKRGGGEIFLEVASKNTAALALYKKCGFIEIGRRNNYYPDDDAITMKCQPKTRQIGTIADIQRRIAELKRETDSCILAHSYMSRDIIEAADYTGDSYQISVNAKESSAKNIIVCGVRFMAETAKLLNPQKRVFLPNPEAGCPMAEQFSPDEIMRLKAENPDRAVVAYINTTAEIKKLCDVCVTSSSAVKIVKNLDKDKILFIPDKNLGEHVRKSTQADVMTIDGGCPFHAAVTAEDVYAAKSKHPNALLLVHPECSPEVVKIADFVGSTSAIMEKAKNSDESEFIIGTEISIREHLQYECPDKVFYPLSGKITCPDMKITTLADLLITLEDIKSGKNQYEIIISERDVVQARRCIDEMLRLS